ncbi:MAG: hypothetical protein FJX33_13050 [Alphaproteobacteria bacterium]|nr:hypothetical protein [Alphaproteobacteria bacterium]
MKDLSLAAAAAGCQDPVKGPVIGDPEPPPGQGTLDTVPGDTSRTVTLAIGGSLGGAVNCLADRDWYAVDLVAGQRYSISLDGAVYGAYVAMSDPLSSFAQRQWESGSAG